MDKINTIIIGAGFSGLSAGYMLKKDYLILEKEDRPGGFAKSEYIKGFTFDYTGHLLHFRNENIKNFILKNAGTKLNILKRNSFIFSCGVFTAYPYQTNMFGLPYNIIEENLVGFLSARTGKVNAENFKSWVETTFGKGIARHFMIPYNKKLLKYDLSRLTTAWLGRFVPVPTVDEIFKGATPHKIDTGYNISFYYPEKGGIESVIKGIYRKIKNNVMLNSKVKFIDLKNKIIYFNKEKLKYNNLITTMNLREFLKKTSDKKLHKLANKLKAVSVYSLNIGFKNKDKNDKHWIYFPEEKYSFYRVGFFDCFSKYNVPHGMSSIFIEMSFKKKILPFTNFKIINNLIDIGIIKSRRDIKIIYPMFLKDAYVIFNKEREKILPEIKKYLEKNNIFLAGRWGKWEYSSMEDAIMDGFNAALKILQRG